MRPVAFALAVALALPTLAAAVPITESEAVDAAVALVARVGSYSARHPDTPGGCASWAGRDVTPLAPLLVHTYPDLRPSYYYVPLRGGRDGSFITIHAATGEWQAFGGRVSSGSYPPVSRESAAAIAGWSSAEMRAVGMPNKHTYWHAGVPGAVEVFVNVDDPTDVHFGVDDRTSPPEPDYEEFLPPGEKERSGGHSGRGQSGSFGRSGGRQRYPSSYDIEGVPYHVQLTSYNCGPAAAEMVMDYWGTDIYQEDIADVANCIDDDGSFNSDIRRSGHFSSLSSAYQDTSLHGYDERKLGYAGLDQWWSLGGTSDPDYPDRYNDLKNLVSQDFPLLLLMKYSPTGGGHFRVLKGYNDSTDVFIAHDPWYSSPYQGPDVNFAQTYFVDTLWSGTANGMRWGTLIAPWEVEVTAPENVIWGSSFTVQAVVTYHGPHPFEDQDGASGREVEIDTTPLFSLAPGETAVKTLPGTATSGTGNLVTWSVVADTAELGNVITVTARGYITDSAYSYPSYSDSIGGWGGQGVTIWDPTTIFVDWDGSGDFFDIQSAIDCATCGDTICVRAGSYSGSENTEISFSGKSVYLVSEEGPGSTIIDCGHEARGFLIDVPVRAQLIIEGFTIRNAATTSTEWPYNCGGGMLLMGTSPTIRNCVFDGCTASSAGGGLGCLWASPIVEDCEFWSCVATGSGGGAVVCYDDFSGRFTRCKFMGNWGENQGGGLWCYAGPTPTIEECTFVGNATLFDGGAMALWEMPSAVITNCTLNENGGGNVGGIDFYYAAGQVTNTIIANGYDGFAVDCSGADSPSFQHCCLYGNAFNDSLCGSYQGMGNMWADPLFCDVVDWTYHLQDCSPCAGTGLGGGDIGAWGVGCPCGDPTGVEGPIPAALRLHPARPSPFGQRTTLALDVPLDAGHVTLEVFNAAGRRVRTLADGPVEPGTREFVWDGRDNAGLRVAAGIYFARCRSDAGSGIQKLVLLR